MHNLNDTVWSDGARRLELSPCNTVWSDGRLVDCSCSLLCCVSAFLGVARPLQLSVTSQSGRLICAYQAPLSAAGTCKRILAALGSEYILALWHGAAGKSVHVLLDQCSQPQCTIKRCMMPRLSKIGHTI